MKRILTIVSLVACVAAGIIMVSNNNADAEEIKLIGVITRIDIAGKDAKTATAVLKDNKTEQEVVITVEDELTLDKFKDHRIQEGDEIRCKYEVKDGRNVSTYFRKTAGC